MLVVDDQILFRILAHRVDARLAAMIANGVATTSTWYFRLARAISADEGGVLSCQCARALKTSNPLFRDSLDRLPPTVLGRHRKGQVNHAMTLSQTMPLQLQVLVEHFEVECRFHNETGMVVADWSSHHAVQHASNCVASFVGSRRLNLHPSVYYASSLVTAPIQIADLIAGTRRRIAEGNTSLADLDRHMELTHSVPNGQAPSIIAGRSYRTKIQLF